MPRPVKMPVLYEDLTYKLIGLGFEIHKELGSVHKELVYQKAFLEELKKNQIPFEREMQLPVLFKGKKVGVYIPDFVIDTKVILELKALVLLPESAGTQLNYYLKATGYKIGLIMNFGARRLQVRRRIYG
jgi:GxxExxY protein